MKNLLIILLATFFGSVLNAQGKYIKDFGSKYEKVRSFLKSNKAATITDESPNRIIASTSNLNLSYHFRDGKLSKLVVQDKSENPGIFTNEFQNKRAKKIRFPKFVSVDDPSLRNHF